MRDAIRKVLIGLAIIVLFFAYASSFIRLLRVRQEIYLTNIEIKKWKQEGRKLAQEIEYLKSDAYIEKAARELLGLVRPGEIPVVVCEPPGPEAPPPVRKRPRDSRFVIGD